MTMNARMLIAVLGLALIAAPPAARAATVFEQLPGANSDETRNSSTLDNFGSPPGFRVADDFALAANAQIAAVEWWGKPGAGGDDFQFTFYAAGAGAPGAVLLTTTGSLVKQTVNVGSGFDPVTFYSSVLSSSFNATAGATYWLAISNQAPDAIWSWLRADNAGNGGKQGLNPGPPWDFDTPDMSFRLIDAAAVPEPSTVLMIGVGFLALGLRSLTRRGAPRP